MVLVNVLRRTCSTTTVGLRSGIGSGERCVGTPGRGPEMERGIAADEQELKRASLI